MNQKQALTYGALGLGAFALFWLVSNRSAGASGNPYAVQDAPSAVAAQTPTYTPATYNVSAAAPQAEPIYNFTTFNGGPTGPMAVFPAPLTFGPSVSGGPPSSGMAGSGSAPGASPDGGVTQNSCGCPSNSTGSTQAYGSPADAAAGIGAGLGPAIQAALNGRAYLNMINGWNAESIAPGSGNLFYTPR